MPKNKPNLNNQVRIIGGLWRGRKIDFPKAASLRPTHDRIRETLFNWLMHDIVDANCLDLFAGSGVLGFEALSRQARAVTMIENHAVTIQQIKANIKKLDIDNCSIIQDDALKYLQKTAAQRFDIVFLDPPFSSHLYIEAAQLLDMHHHLNDHAKIYLEVPKQSPVADLPKRWQCLKSKSTSTIDYYLFQINST